MKKYCIVTASDALYGDFLINHWFQSLRDNCSLDEIDVVVLDYGLSTDQRYYLKSHNVILRTCEKNGHVVIIRFRDLAQFLTSNPYKQVAMTDGGDIIFQDDILPVFTTEPDKFRGVPEDLRSGFDIFLTEEFFSSQDKKCLSESLMSGAMVNAGFIVGSGEKMKLMGETVDRMVKIKEKFGPDQLVVNYLFRTEGFAPLDRRFNFVIATAKAKLTIENGRFFADSELIAVVHNSGNFSFFRPVENFGYGPKYNLLKIGLLKVLKAINSISNTYIEARTALKNYVRTLGEELTTSYQKSQYHLEERYNNFSKFFIKKTE